MMHLTIEDERNVKLFYIYGDLMKTQTKDDYCERCCTAVISNDIMIYDLHSYKYNLNNCEREA